MQIKAITVNAAGTIAAERGIQGNGASGVNQVKAENGNVFGPEYKVTISREGKNLSKRQTGAETQSVKEERRLLRQQDEEEFAKGIRDGYREKLNEIDKQITEYNTSHAKIKMKKVLHDAALMDETVEEQQKLRTAIERQKEFQAEESQRRAREAQQMADQSAQYREEIDENNRELLTLLKTMEEAEKAEDEQENGGAKGGGSSTSETGNSAGNAIKASAAQFMSSSINGERIVEEMLTGVEESGRWFIDTADSITQNMLQRTSDIRAALDDEAFSDDQIAEMMQSLQEGLALDYDNVRDFRGFGLQVMRDTREAKIQHVAADPLKGMQQTKRSMALSAVDAALGEARQGSLDETSRALADEVKKLIDERNDVDRTPRDEEEVKEEAKEEAKEEQSEQVEDGEQAGTQEKLLQPKEQDRGSI